MSPTQRAPSSRIGPPLARLVLGGCLLGALALPLFAEVSVETDARGKYTRTLVLLDSHGSRPQIWSQVRRNVDPSRLLNVGGDRTGDSPPVVLEQPGTRQPWVLWAKGDGHDKEIAYATWSGGRWIGPALVEKADNAFDDLNPRLAFDSAGNPVVVWWRREPISRIFMSRFLNGAWTPAAPVSDPTVPARNPSIRLTAKEAVVSFFTSRGMTVLFVPLPKHPPASAGGAGPLDGPVPPPDQRSGPSNGSGTSEGGLEEAGDFLRPDEL